MSVPVRVLFVEDARDDVERILFELRRGGLTPDHWIVDSPEAMRHALSEEPWDVVIAAHSLVRFDAIRALEVLRESGRDLPFIVVSGHIGEDLAVACMKAGAHDCLVADDLARLVPAVERELREAEQRRQRREAVQALRASEERYRLLVEAADEAILLLDTEGHVTFANPSASRLLGQPPEEIVGRRLDEFAHDEDLPRLRETFSRALAEGAAPLPASARVRHRDGGWRVVAGSATRLVEADGSVRVLAMGHDVTERVQLAQQLHQAQ